MAMSEFRYERFPVCAGCYIDVRRARGLIAARPRETVRMYVPKLRRFLRQKWVVVNYRHARWGKLKDEPLVAIRVCGILCVVDGWHRVWRASHEKKRWLRAHVLTPQEAAECGLPMEKFK
jgi:hypothetical protein